MLITKGGQDKMNPLDSQFGELANQTIEEWKVPGLAIAVIDNEDIFSEGYGFASLPDKRATPETVWYCASTTKAFTGACLAKLIDEKKHTALSNGWGTPISAITPEDFVLEDDWATRHITLEDAISHRSGMSRHDKAPPREDGVALGSVRDVVRNLRHLPLGAEPRTKFIYCNTMYAALSHAIETVTGKPMGQVLKEDIWNPLGMDSTFFELKDAIASGNLATGYAWDDGAKVLRQAEYMETTELSGAGAMFSNVLDYAKWIRCLLHEQAPFSKDAHKDIRTPRFVAGGLPSGHEDICLYSLGWERVVYRGHVVYKHPGDVASFGAQTYWLPEKKFGAVAFGNGSIRSNVAEDILIRYLIDGKLGVKDSDSATIGEQWHQLVDSLHDQYRRAVDNLYPDRPRPGLPPTLDIDQLEGAYHHPGYKTIILRKEKHPDKPGEYILAGNSRGFLAEYRHEFHHASGDYWVAYNKPSWGGYALLSDYSAAEFRFGSDGRVSTLEVTWMNHIAVDLVEGAVSFSKVS